MNRYKTNEKLMAATRQRIPAAAEKWLAAVRQPLEKLTIAALAGDISDEQFRTMVQDFSASLPGMLEKIDTAPLAELMEHSMGAALANGITARTPTKTTAKLPWETDTYLAAQKRKGTGKKCGNSYISSSKECRVNLGPLMEGSEESMKRRAGDAMRALPKILSHPETGFEFEINNTAIGKTLNQAVGKGKGAPDLTAAAQMGKIFLESKKNPPEPDRKNHHGVKAFHTFSTKVRIGGVDREAVITVTEYEANNDPTKQMPHFKLFRLRSIKKGT